MIKKFLFVLVLATLLVGCGGGGEDLEIDNVWGRSSPNAAENGAFYMTITNNTNEAEVLQSVSTEACRMVELHEMYMMEGDVMGMRPVEGEVIPIAAGETVELKVGGLHVMCMGKTESFDVGKSFELSLAFENAGNRTVTADILESAPE